MVSGLADGTIELWDFNKGSCLKAFKAHHDAISCLAVLSNGQVFSGSTDGTLNLWNLEDESCVADLRLSWYCADDFDFFTSIAILSNDQVACSSHRRLLVLWDWEKETAKFLKRRGSDCICVALPNRQVITSYNSIWVDTLELWDLNKPVCLQTFKGHSNSITSIAVLSNERIMSGSKDASIKLWDLKKGTCLKTFKGDSASINCLTTLSDEQIAGGTEDGTLKIWDLNTHLLTTREQADVLTAVSNNQSLKTLDLSHVNINELPAGVGILKTILCCHPTLTKIYLDSTDLSKEQLQILLISIIKNQKITQFWVDDTPVIEGGKIVISSFDKNTALSQIKDSLLLALKSDGLGLLIKGYYAQGFTCQKASLAIDLNSTWIWKIDGVVPFKPCIDAYYDATQFWWFSEEREIRKQLIAAAYDETTSIIEQLCTCLELLFNLKFLTTKSSARPNKFEEIILPSRPNTPEEKLLDNFLAGWSIIKTTHNTTLADHLRVINYLIGLY